MAFSLCLVRCYIKNIEPSNKNCCICYKILSHSEIVTKAVDILEILKLLVLNLNCTLLQDSIICETCLTKVQSAYKFKILHSEDAQTILDNVKVEETNLEEFTCEICKKIIDRNDSIPFFDSVLYQTTLIKHFPLKFGSKESKNPQTCGKCHELLLNFCIITNSISIFGQDDTDDINELGEEKKNIQQIYDKNVLNSNKTFKIEIKKEDETDCECQDVKQEMTYMGQDMKEEKYDDSVDQVFLLKNEEVDLKFDKHSEDELSWKPDAQYTEKISNLSTHSNRLPDLSVTNVDSIKKIPETASNSKHQAKQAHLLIPKASNKIGNITRCPICNFQTKYFEHHMLIHKNEQSVQMFYCNICNYKSQHKNYFKQHMLLHKNVKEPKTLHCEICDFQTKKKSSFKQHIQSHKNVNPMKMFYCTICKFGTKHYSVLKTHMLSHKNTNETEMFQCQNCEFQSKYKSSLKHHLLIHKSIEEIKTFQCQICGFQFKRKNTLREHIKLIHKPITEIEFFQCQICKHQAKRKSDLKQHMLKHKDVNEIEMLQCNVCDYQSKRKSGLKQHMLTHKGVHEVENFKCQSCEFQTKYKNSLKHHLLIHQNDNDAEMFPCNVSM